MTPWPTNSENSSKQNELNILLTEDDADVARYLTTVLKTLGHKVIGLAVDGKQAITMALELQPDLVIMDIDLPEINGVEASQTILQHISVPVIISTGRTDSEALDSTRELNIQAYLVKPFSAVQLKSAIAIAMSQHGLHNQSQKKIVELSGALESSTGLSDAEVLTTAKLRAIGLTRREADALHWIAQGKSNVDIALILQSSPRTIAKHIEHVFKKLKVDSRTAAVTQARQVVQCIKE